MSDESKLVTIEIVLKFPKAEVPNSDLRIKTTLDELVLKYLPDALKAAEALNKAIVAMKGEEI